MVDKERFPHGMKYLVDYIHSKGLKFGIYSGAGTKTCQGRPGGRGHEYQDARTYARWALTI
jgi:alpha-galactosidase